MNFEKDFQLSFEHSDPNVSSSKTFIQFFEEETTKYKIHTIY